MAIHLQREIEGLKRMILSLGARVEQALHNAIYAVKEKDTELANETIASDIEIDAIEVDIEEECLKILALHQPVAIDLRFIIAVLKINNDMERIGDLASNIAECVQDIARYPGAIIDIDFTEMSDAVKVMLKSSLDALVNLDIEAAKEVTVLDNKVDQMHTEIYGKVKEAIKTNPEQLNPLLHLMAISKHLERVGDCTTNIAEDIVYMINGRIVRHKDKL